MKGLVNWLEIEVVITECVHTLRILMTSQNTWILI